MALLLRLQGSTQQHSPSGAGLQAIWELQDPGVLAQLILPGTAPKHHDMGAPLLVLQHCAGMPQPPHRPCHALQHQSNPVLSSQRASRFVAQVITGLLT